MIVRMNVRKQTRISKAGNHVIVVENHGRSDSFPNASSVMKDV